MNLNFIFTLLITTKYFRIKNEYWLEVYSSPKFAQNNKIFLRNKKIKFSMEWLFFAHSIHFLNFLLIARINNADKITERILSVITESDCDISVGGCWVYVNKL